jgi:vitamin B12 transporter
MNRLRREVVMKPVLVSILTFLTFSALGQTSVSDTIVVTASQLPETVESTPASVTVITRQDIDDRAARDLADVLREVPGVTISRTGSPGKATSLFTRGANSTHTLVLWNGIEINNPYFAGYDWGRFSTAGVSQVEVVRGPYSALYGSDAVAGVVNVLTNPQKSGVHADLEAGGHGLRNGNVEADWVSGGNLLSASYEHRRDDGFEPNDDFGQNVANLFWRWTSSNHFTLGLAARRTTYDLGIPTNLNAAGTAIIASPNRRQSGNERQLAVPIGQTVGRFGYELTLSESRRSDDFSDPDDPYGYVSGTTDSRTRRARLTTRTATPVGTVIVGGEYERDVVNDVTNFGPNLQDNRRRDTSLFVEDRYEHELGGGAKLELTAGARRDDYDTFGSATSPRLAAAWIMGSGKLRAAFGESFRAPSVGELYFPFSGNKDLQPERSRSAELGYDFLLGGGLASVTLFRGRYRDLIVFDNATYAFGNVGRARTAGVELSLQRRLAGYDASLSYTYLDAKQDGTGTALLRRPKHSGSLFIGRQLGRFETNVALLHTGSRFDVLPVAPFSTISDKAYTTVDVNVQLRGDRFTPYVKLENAANKRYEEVAGYPSPGRRAVFGVRVGI